MRVLMAATRVLTFDGTRQLTSASGFFFRRDAQVFVVTSRHVLFDEPSGHHPDRIQIQCHTSERDLTQVCTVEMPLYGRGLSLWRQGRDSGGEVDVATLALDAGVLPAVNALQTYAPDDLGDLGAELSVGDSLVIPGFPLGFHDTLHHLPVARHAAIASAFGVRFQGQGFFLTDSRTHRGSSGAPVLWKTRDADGALRWRLLGVHSSRLDMSSRDRAQDESLGLNCAWYADILLTLTAPASPA
jgi:hypothetical protein